MTEVCDICGSEDIEYCDKDDTYHYCSDCYESLEEEIIQFQKIKNISVYIKEWSQR